MKEYPLLSIKQSGDNYTVKCPRLKKAVDLNECHGCQYLVGRYFKETVECAYGTIKKISESSDTRLTEIRLADMEADNARAKK